MIRLFRNRIGMGYVRKVHNQLQACGVGANSRIRIRHYGYHLTPEQMEVNISGGPSRLSMTWAVSSMRLPRHFAFRQWPLAEVALQSAPAFFDLLKFGRMLPGNAPTSNKPA